MSALATMVEELRIDATHVQRVKQWMDEHQDEVIADLFAFVALETPSNDKALLQRGVAWIEEWVSRHLPAPSGRELLDGGEHGDVLVLTYLGQGERVLSFLSHYDTVWDAGTTATWSTERVGERASGPGIYDMKTGLVQSLWMMRALFELDLPLPTIHMLFTGDEEIGSPFARAAIEDFSVRSSAVIVFEASEREAVKTERKGIGRFQISITGRESHAGADYTAGVSAIDELARLTLQLHALTDLDEGTTVNVGVIGGGSRSNVLAGSAWADVDVRFTKNAEMDRIQAALSALASHHPDAVISLSGGWNRPAMERGPLTVGMYRLAAEAASAIDVELGETSVGGGSDGNFAYALGIPVLDGMGAVGAGPHARSEHVFLDRIPERGAIAAGVIAAFARPDA